MTSFVGSMPALVTPFANGKIDIPALERLVDFQIEAGTHGLVACGTTGEAATLTDEEYQLVVSTVVQSAQKRVPVIAGAGSNATAKAIELSRLANQAGADGLLHVTPYYNKPTQNGLIEHFTAIAESTPLPIILYNVPGRTGLNMTAETTITLSQIKNIVGIKEASKDLEQVATIINNTTDSFSVYSGDDPLNLEICNLGGRGFISVTANIVPKALAKVWNLHSAYQTAAAADLHENLQKLNAALFIESNPIPVKTALHLMGYVQEEFRLPLCCMHPENRKELQAVLRDYKLIVS